MIDLQKVSNTPGVYKFFNKHKIIYIGKVKDEKKSIFLFLENPLKIKE